MLQIVPGPLHFNNYFTIYIPFTFDDIIRSFIICAKRTSNIVPTSWGVQKAVNISKEKKNVSMYTENQNKFVIK